MLGRRKGNKHTTGVPARAGLDDIVPGQPMAPAPGGEQPWKVTAPVEPTPAAPPAPAPPAATPPAQSATDDLLMEQLVAAVNTPRTPAAPPSYQSPPQPDYENRPAPAHTPPGPPGAVTPPPSEPAAATGNPVDGLCTKCASPFGQTAACASCGTSRTACFVCGTKIWAGALTCSEHSGAVRR
jgi:hypothetical protein